MTLKKMFALFLLLYMAAPLLAQTNQFRDDNLLGEKEHKQVLKSKLKEIKIYLFHYKDTILGADSMLIAKYNYDKMGYLTEQVNYRLSEYGNKVPPVAAHFVDLHNDDGNIIQHGYYVIRYSMFNNKILGSHTEDNQAVTYQYDKENKLVQDIDHVNNFMQQGQLLRERIGTGVTDYSYDSKGNLLLKISHDLDGKFTYRNEYTYDNKDALIKILTYIDSVAEIPYVRQTYLYTHGRNGLTKLESIYNNNNLLFAQREFVYDKRGNQVKGYEINSGVRRLVWDYIYDKNNRVTESYGGPGSRFGPGYKAYGYSFRYKVTAALGPANPFGPYSMDIRCDGVARLFYTYDKKGNLTEIRKYNTEADDDGKLNMAEKFYYTTY